MEKNFGIAVVHELFLIQPHLNVSLWQRRIIRRKLASFVMPKSDGVDFPFNFRIVESTSGRIAVTIHANV